MSELVVLLYLAYVTLLGLAWMRLLKKTIGWEDLAWGFGVGTIVWAYAQFLLNVFHIQTRGALFYVWQAGLVVVPLLFYRRPQASISDLNGRQISDFRLWKPHYWLCIPVAIALLTSLLQALTFPMHMWDSIVIYGYKAKILFYKETFRTEAFLDPSVLHINADYPLLIPYLEAGFYRWLGHPDDRAVRLLFVGHWTAWLGMIYAALSRRIHKEYALVVCGVVATLPLFSSTFMGQAASGFADIPFGFYWTGFLLCLVKTSGVRGSKSGSLGEPAMTALFALGCVFTKNEGIPAVIIGLVLCAFSLRPRFQDFGLRTVLPTALLLVPWIWTRYFLPHNSVHTVRLLALPWDEAWQRMYITAYALGRELFHVRNWGLYWILVAAGLLWPATKRPFPRESKMLFAAAGLQMCAYVYAYLTYSQDFDFVLPITLLRLMVHLIGPLTLAIGWRLADDDRAGGPR